MLLSISGKTLKAVLLYCAILAVVALTAAVIGCLVLSDGRTAYLLDPDKLLWFAWSKRSGLKVQIFFIATVLWWMLALDGALGRPWLRGLWTRMPRVGARASEISKAGLQGLRHYASDFYISIMNGTILSRSI